MKVWQILLILLFIFLAAIGVMIYRYVWPAPEISYPPLSEVSRLEDLIRPYLADERTHALSIGIVQESQVNYQYFGHTQEPDSPPPDSNTIYEIGSITKTFTAAVLAEMVSQGKVKYEDPIAQYLPEGVVNWDDSLRITLLELATHTSGLPRVPGNMTWESLLHVWNPYANYTGEDLYDFLRDYTPKPVDERDAAYSNLGYGLLGHLLARVEGVDYETLVDRYLLQPLKMSSTSIAMSEAQQTHFAAGFDKRGFSTSPWDFQSLAGAGALRSTTADMLRYVQANLSGQPPFPTTHQPRAELRDSIQVGLAWVVETLPATGREITWHNGGTGGFRSFAGMDKENRTGVVVLSNTALSVDEIGKGVLALLSQENAN